ncbi:MAG: F0F1 ATP synthase subunit epsilon [Thermodesulfovibrio sp.]|jgi:F-type H+-transporting ATPase subunit epsilon|uniref:ATP synthase epsilon chain n=2 Tax=Thermodesulfovibrio TaxID=28261 RepID=A0A2J6WGJ1_9BACT|nr:MAG: ATP synthase F1 subunit epsilon [Thermodesulfovibrio aggregans]
MADKLKLEVITPYGEVVNEEVDEVYTTGAEGDFGVLPGHCPFMTAIRIGSLSYKKDGQMHYLFVNRGYCEVLNDRVLVLVGSAERVEEIDIERAKAALARAEERIRKAQAGETDIDLARAQAALERATIRIQLATKLIPR